MKMIYKEIQRKLFYMLPERWDSIYLYASVIQHAKLETGEMFFYYIPKGVIKKKPINVYEIPSKFNIEEDDYLRLVDNLYNEIKALRNEMINIGEKPWSNLTISIEKTTFKVEFRYENLSKSVFSSSDRHLAWKYEYLNKPINSFTRKERDIVQKFLKEREFLSNEVEVYTENLYLEKEVKSIIYFDREEEKPQNQVVVNDIETKENKIKNSILNEIIQEKENQKEDTIIEDDLVKKHKSVTLLKDIKPSENDIKRAKSQILNY